jgi:hypothetical protein
MAIQFDAANDYYSIVDAAELTLQDGDWCVGLWTYVADNAGSAYQYTYSNNGYAANNSINLFLVETGEGTGNINKWGLVVQDGDGTSVSLVSSTAPGADSTWRLIVAQRRTADNQVQLWFCEPKGAASKVASAADTNFDAVNGAAWNVARRVDGDANRYYGGVLCEMFKGDFSLTQAQIEALAAGLPIKTLAAQAGLTLDLYLPAWTADATLIDYSGSGNDATRQDAPTTATHAPVCTPAKRRRM